MKSPKTKTLADGLIERTSSMLDDIESKTVHKDKVSDQQRKKSLSHTEEESQESLIQGKIHNQKKSNEGLEYLKIQALKICAIQNYLVYMLLIVWP